MGRRSGPSRMTERRRPSPRGPLHRCAVACCLGLGLAGSFSAARAETMAGRITRAILAQNKSGEKHRLLVNAQELVYDHDHNRVEARGNVQLYYQGRVLQA